MTTPRASLLGTARGGLARRARPLVAIGPVLALAACGSSAPGAMTPPHTDTAPRGGDAGSADGAPELGTIASLAASGAAIARGMREAERAEITIAAGSVDRDIVRAGPADTCVRVAFAASAAVGAALIDDKDRVLVAVDAATGGALGERGPACVRRGDAIRLRISVDHGGAPVRLRYVAWRSP